MADQNAEVTALDFLGMSDEELMNVNPASLVLATADEDITDAANTSNDKVDEQTGDDEAAKAATQSTADAEDDKQDDDAGDSKDAGDEDDETADVAGGTDDAKSKADEDTADSKSKAAPAKADTTESKEVKKEDEGDDKAKSGTEGAKDESAVIDYKTEYEKLFAPIKANGREIQVKSAEDAIALMQMGANYNKKMTALKPNLKLMKMLEQAGLLDEGKLSYLIDLDKKDPAAISKLVMDSKLDPLDLSNEKAAEYKQGNHAVDDSTMELDAVIDSLKESKHYSRTLEVVSSEWDQASKGEIVKNPGIMQVINGHMEIGIYDRIHAEIESERTFGRLKGLSDLEAYRKVGDAINERGGFNDLIPGSSKDQAKAPPAAKVIVTPKPKQAEVDKLKEQKRAAGATKTSVKAGTVADFNPLAMSDEDFKTIKF